MINHLFAVERYDSQRESLQPPPSLPPGAPARLIGVLQLTDDGVGIALVEGPDSETVTASMTKAGWRVDRVTGATWLAAPADGGEQR